MTAAKLVSIAIDDLFAYAQFRDSFGVTIETPNLDALIARSVNFGNAYAAVMTGPTAVDGSTTRSTAGPATTR